MQIHFSCRRCRGEMALMSPPSSRGNMFYAVQCACRETYQFSEQEYRMDDRRFNTGQLLDMGILDMPKPTSKCPDRAALAEIEQEDYTEESLRAGLESGGIAASQYYGVWKIWKTESGFSGELLQYRAVTDEFTDISLDDALDKAEEWLEGCYG